VLARLLHGTSHEFDAPGLLIQLWGEAVTDAAIREVVRGYLVFLRSAFREYFLAWARRGKGLQGAAAEAWVEAILPVAIGIGQGYMFQRALLADFDEDEYLRVAGELLAAR
jgi:hypothetical protein